MIIKIKIAIRFNRAKPIWWNPKKTIVHVLLKKIWIKYIFKILISNVLVHIFQIAKDIIKYKVDHTGANTQLGGLKLGSINCEYQGSLNADVAYPPTAGAKKVISVIKQH